MSARRNRFGSGASASDEELRVAFSPDRSEDTGNPFARKGAPMLTRAFGESGHSSLTQSFLALGGNEVVTKPFIESPWINACVRAHIRAVLKTRQRFKDGPDVDDELIDRKDRRVQGLDRLLRRPNPNLKGGELRALLTAFSLIDGESFLFLLKRKGGSMQPIEPSAGGVQGPNARIPMPDEVWIIRGAAVGMELNEDTQMPQTWWFQTKGGKRFDFPAHAVTQIREMNPDNPYRGIGPVQAAARAIQQDFQAERFDEALLANGGQPGGVFQAKTSGPVPDTVKQEIRESYIQQHAKPQKDRIPMVLGGNLDYRVLAHSPREMELIEKRSANKRIILALLGVPAPLLAHTEDVQNRSVAETADRVFWTNSVGPNLNWQEEQINEGLVHRIDGYEDVWVDHDLSTIESLKPDTTQMIKDAAAMWMEGGRSWREAATAVGLPFDDGAEGLDQRFIPKSQVPAEVALEVARGDAQGGGGQREVKTVPVQITTPDAAPLVRSTEVRADPAPTKVAVEDADPDPELTESEAKWAEGFDGKAYFQAFEKALEPLDRRMSEALRPSLTRYLRDMKRRIQKQAKKSLPEMLADPKGFAEGVELSTKQSTADVERQLLRLLRQGIDRYETDMAKAYKGPMQATWDEAASGLADEIGVDGFLDHASPAALRYLKNKPIRLAEGVFSRLSSSVKEALMTTMAQEGVNSGTLSARLSKILSKADERINRMAGGVEARADRIARTENTSIAGRARAEEMLRDEIEKHMWVANPPGSGTRDDHISLNGRIREVGKSFGFNLRWPGDSQASAEQFVECRCTTAPAPRNS